MERRKCGHRRVRRCRMPVEFLQHVARLGTNPGEPRGTRRHSECRGAEWGCSRRPRGSAHSKMKGASPFPRRLVASAAESRRALTGRTARGGYPPRFRYCGGRESRLALILGMRRDKVCDRKEKIRGYSGMRLSKLPTSRRRREKWGTRPALPTLTALFERLDGGGFVVFHVEDGVELGDLK